MPHIHVQMLIVMELLDMKQPGIGSVLNVLSGLNTYRIIQQN